MYHTVFEKSIFGIETFFDTLDIDGATCYNSTVDHRDVAQMGTFPSAAGGGCSEEKGGALPKEGAKRTDLMAATGSRARTEKG